MATKQTIADEFISTVREERPSTGSIVNVLNAFCIEQAETQHGRFWKMQDGSIVSESGSGIFDTDIPSRFPKKD